MSIIEAAAKAHWIYIYGPDEPWDTQPAGVQRREFFAMRAALCAMAKCEPTDRMFEIWSDGLNLLDKNARRDCADEWRALLLAAAEEE